MLVPCSAATVHSRGGPVHLGVAPDGDNAGPKYTAERRQFSGATCKLSRYDGHAPRIRCLPQKFDHSFCVYVGMHPGLGVRPKNLTMASACMLVARRPLQ